MHEAQLREYVRLGRINVVERINVNQAYLHLYRRDAQYEYLTIYMAVRMGDYIIDEKTREVLKGDPNREYDMQLPPHLYPPPGDHNQRSRRRGLRLLPELRRAHAYHQRGAV